MHDLAWRRDPANFTRNGVQFFEAGLRWVVDDADLVLCPSRATLEDCVAAGIEPVPAAPRAVGHDDGRRDRGRRRGGAQAVRPHRAVRASVGTLEPRKNLPRLLEAFARLPHHDVTLAVVGPEGGATPRPPADGWATGCGSGLRAPTATSDLSTVERRWSATRAWWRATACRSPRRWARRPVVTSTVPPPRSWSGGAGLAVDPTDLDAIAGAVAAVLDDDDLADRLRAAGRERAAATWARPRR